VSGGRRAAVLGFPVSHSLSPLLHRSAYAALGLDWEYEAIEVQSGGLPAFLEGVDDSWVGLSLTMPLKGEAARCVDFLEPLAKALGAVNTVLFESSAAGGHRVGANTDVPGLVAALREAGVESVGSAVILGAGSTATAAMAALATLGCSAPTVALRDRSRAGGLLMAASKLGTNPRLTDIADVRQSLERADVVVSTVPAVAGAAIGSALRGASVEGTLLDAVYDPVRTPLLEAWSQAGGTPIDGTRMLLHQAAEQVRLFSGQAAPLAAMDSALLSHLSH
jgi:shikimate dehydrogenase